MATSALVNFRVSADPRGVVTAQIDMPGKTYNVLNREAFAELGQLLDDVERDFTVRLVIFRGGKPSGFLAGADLHELESLDSPDAAKRLGALGQELFDRLEHLSVPTVAAIHGPCLGGGLEFALACGYRLARDDERTQLGLPEVELGLLPAWGATQRLPALVGTAAAVALILDGRKLSARQAADNGLVDETWPADRFELEVERFVSGLLAGRPVRRHRPGLATRLFDHTRLGRWVSTQGTRGRAARLCPDNPAPAAAWRAVERGFDAGPEAGLARAREEFSQLLFTPACRCRIDRFFHREPAPP